MIIIITRKVCITSICHYRIPQCQILTLSKNAFHVGTTGCRIATWFFRITYLQFTIDQNRELHISAREERKTNNIYSVAWKRFMDYYNTTTVKEDIFSRTQILKIRRQGRSMRKDKSTDALNFFPRRRYRVKIIIFL